MKLPAANSRSKQLPPCVTFAKWEKGQWTTRPGLILTLCFVPRADKKSVSKPTVAVSGLCLKTCFEFRTEEQDCR